MKDEIEVLVEMYKVQVSRSEHYENQRAMITNLVLTLSSALVAIATFDGIISDSDLWNGLLIILLGLFGYSASRLHAARSRRHGKRAAAYRDELDKKLPKAGINLIREQVKEESTYLYHVWNGIHIVVISIGTLISVLSVVK